MDKTVLIVLWGPWDPASCEMLDSLSPAESQTGPAARCDLQVIANHLSMLDGDKRSIYDLLSRSIMKRAGGEDRQR